MNRKRILLPQKECSVLVGLVLGARCGLLFLFFLLESDLAFLLFTGLLKEGLFLFKTLPALKAKFLRLRFLRQSMLILEIQSASRLHIRTQGSRTLPMW